MKQDCTKQGQAATRPGGKTPIAPSQGGFTLIELLVVITIIGIIAAMVAGLSGLAARKKHDAVVNAMKNRLVLIIESYHTKLGFYPPDNMTNSSAPSPAAYEASTAMNQLLYELPGSTLTNVNPAPSFLVFDGTIISGPNDISPTYQRGGIANSNPDEPHNFFQPLPKPAEYAPYTPLSKLKGLLVPVPLNGSSTNFWHYDSSSSNRHNPNSFDLWAEYDSGKDSSNNPVIITNGNW